jgi:hypothetical protein
MSSQTLQYNVLLVICQFVYCLKKDLDLSESLLEEYLKIVEEVLLQSQNETDIEDNLKNCLKTHINSINKNAMIDFDCVRLEVLEENIPIEQFETNPIKENKK